MQKLVRRCVNHKMDSGNNGWLSEWAKKLFGRKNQDSEGSSEDTSGKEDKSSSSSSGDDGGIKIPIPDFVQKPLS